MMNQGAVRGGSELIKVKGVILNEGKIELLKQFEDYLIARNRRSIDRYLRIASEYLASWVEEESERFQSSLRRCGGLRRRLKVIQPRISG